MGHMYKNKCISCGEPYRQYTRHQHKCVNCLHKEGPDLKINVGNFNAELYTELIPIKRMNKLFTNLRKYAKQCKENEK